MSLSLLVSTFCVIYGPGVGSAGAAGDFLPTGSSDGTGDLRFDSSVNTPSDSRTSLRAFFTNP